MTSEAEVDRAFAYAATAGMGVMVGVPEHDLLGRAERKVQETGVSLAIHNHGPGDLRYPTPASVLGRISKLDPRIGVCLDVGHCRRSGIDPAQAAVAAPPPARRPYEGRLGRGGRRHDRRVGPGRHRPAAPAADPDRDRLPGHGLVRIRKGRRRPARGPGRVGRLRPRRPGRPERSRRLTRTGLVRKLGQGIQPCRPRRPGCPGRPGRPLDGG
ncbi:MAG: sugar phosphate isomerase/epimerase [Rhodopseudomonas palustris]|nr:sugar phosphate isomerase/epimerase [Rhodopseudomonas palustris]